jgi:hypothetical protein
MSNVTEIAAHLMSLKAPAALAKMQSWLIWRYEPNPNGKKPLKIPYYADGNKRHGVQGSDKDKSRLTTFELAKAAAAKGGFTGVGIAMLGDHDITALDFDNCYDGSGELPPEIKAIAERTYAEISPSGHGIRAFVRGSYGSQKSPTTQDQYGFETFFDSGFVTFTGHVLPATLEGGSEDHVARVNDIVDPLVTKRFGGARTRVYDPNDPTAVLEKVAARTGRTIEEMEETLRKLDPDCDREEWIRVAMGTHHETEGDDTGFQLWNEWSMGGAKYPGEEALRAQWDSFTRRDGGRRQPVTFATVIRMAKQLRPDLDVDPEPIEEENRSVGPYQTDDSFDGKYPIISALDFMNRPPTDWLIKNVLPRAEIGVLYGASGSGKSFVALDFAITVALGSRWRGHRVKKGHVLYIAAEGAGGLGARISAYQQGRFLFYEEEVDCIGKLGIIAAAPDFLLKDDIDEVLRAIKAAGPANLVIVDTFAQVTPGANENSAEGIGKALAHGKAIHKATGALVLFVHHSGKDQSRGARGWSGIRAAADVEIEVCKNDDGVGLIQVTKMKDGRDDGYWGFALEQVTLGFDADGDPVSSCFVIPREVSRAEFEPPKKFGLIENALMEAVTQLAASDQPKISKDELIALVADQMPAPGLDENGNPKRDQRKSNVKRSLDTLIKKGALGFEGEYVVMPAEAPADLRL